jgi:hypothetical protein
MLVHRLFVVALMIAAGCGGRSEHTSAGRSHGGAAGSGTLAVGGSGNLGVGGTLAQGGSAGVAGSAPGGGPAQGDGGAAGAPDPMCISDAECSLGCDNGRCISLDALEAYIKASNTDAVDHFGAKVALSADGTTLAVGAPLESSAATGVDGDQASNAASFAGAVYVFRRDASGWAQEAYLKASNSAAEDRFGASLALSADGTLLVVGATREASAARGIGGDDTNDGAPGSGAAYVFRRSTEGTWAQEVYLKASNGEAGDGFGYLTLSADGSTLAVAALGEDSGATTINGDQTDNGSEDAAALYVFRHGESGWTQEAYVKRDDSAGSVAFGSSLSLSTDGSLLAAGAMFENAGVVYVFGRSAGGSWSQEARVLPSSPNSSDNFGAAVDLSGDGTILAVGSPFEDSEARGISDAEVPTGLGASASGAAYVFRREEDGTWVQEAFIKASNRAAGKQFGRALALSSDGLTLAAGALDDSSARGIGGDEDDFAATSSGAVYVIRRSQNGWRQIAYVKASNSDRGDWFGCESLDLSADGNTLAVGATMEASGARGIDGDQADNSAEGSGAVYVYR